LARAPSEFSPLTASGSARAEAAAGEIAPGARRRLGDPPHDHVRLEERELFEEIGQIVPAAELEGVKL